MIKDYEEAQGITAEMVREYLSRTGWWLSQKDARSELWKKINNTDAPGIWLHPKEHQLGVYLDTLARFEGRTLQSLLRAINPRLHGWPSAAEIKAHSQRGGLWIGRVGTLGDGGAMVVCSFDVDHAEYPLIEWSAREEWRRIELTRAELAEWRFWPIDEHGNKLPRVGV